MSIITLEEYKTYAGILNPNQDSTLTPIVAFVNDLIPKVCGISIGEVTKTDYPVTLIWDSILFKEHPVNNITSLSIKTTGQVIDPTTYELNTEEGCLDILEEPITLPRTKNSLVCTYTYGFITAPDALVQAAHELVQYYAKREFNKSRNQAGEGATYATAKGIPPHVMAGLNLYRVI